MLSETPELATRNNGAFGWRWQMYPVFMSAWWDYGDERINGHVFFVKIENSRLG